WLGGQYRRRFKAWNKNLYYVTKFGLIIGGVALIVFI
ncbi:MAG TPA: lipid A hydroxylase LpxO, partial [Cupriavidus sp.]|nr:lipid A hydroxylase LpxO [Cupriavidus sp.]